MPSAREEKEERPYQSCKKNKTISKLPFKKKRNRVDPATDLRLTMLQGTVASSP